MDGSHRRETERLAAVLIEMKMRNSPWAGEAGAVRWMFLIWFLIFVAGYAVLIGVAMSVINPDPDRGVAILRAAGFPGLIAALVCAKLMTRKRYQKP